MALAFDFVLDFAFDLGFEVDLGFDFALALDFVLDLGFEVDLGFDLAFEGVLLALKCSSISDSSSLDINSTHPSQANSAV
ncbi:MAG: hypothetical protein QF885_06505 [Candidatus Thalassarchaeaceae archaeon]|nr:hypothetical protein [Candidatus Thalassarchaeaceae archaeon]